MAAIKQGYQLLKKGNPLLKQKSLEVKFPLSEEIETAQDHCIDTLRNVEGYWNKKSIAISAPQVGQFHQFFVMCDRQFWYHPKLMYKKFVTFYNPVILEYSKETIQAWEGCISNDDDIVLVERPKDVKVQFINFKGIQTDMICQGLISRIFQHELDHLNGEVMEEKALETYPISKLILEEDFEKFTEDHKDRILIF